MLSRFIHHAWYIVLVALAASWPSMGLAQFKDLDQTETPRERVSKVDGSELAPTSEPFLSPEAPVAQRPTQPKVAPEAASSQSPQPVPMPELNAANNGNQPTLAAPVQSEVSPSVDDSKDAGTTQAVKSSKPEAEDVEASPDKEAKPVDALDRFQRAVKSARSSSMEPAKFNGMQPGVSTKEQLVKAWGEPQATLEKDGEPTRLVYQIPGIKQIDVSLNEQEVVTNIVVHLEEPQKISHVAKELGVTKLAAVPIPDEYGEILGQAYPERGILFSFTDDMENLRVSTILLETLSAEMFRLRAQYDFGHHYERSLADTNHAIELDPKDGEAYWLRAQLFDLMGQTREAVKSVQKAIRLEPTDARFRLTRARLYAKTSRVRTAMDDVKEIIRELDLPAELAGRAHNLLGDMYAMGQKADHQQALKHHLKAIDFAVKAVSDERFAVRRAAKHVLVNAHGSVARDIAMGNFQRQSQVVPKWLLRATEMADEFISDDQGDELLQMQIFRDTLASYAELKSGEFDAEVAIEEALKTGRQMIADASDHYYKIQVERMLAESLFHAAKIHRNRGRYDLALKFSNNALGLLDGSEEEWELLTHDHYLEANLLFLAGSVYAVRDNNHFEAVDHYKKVRKLFTKVPGYTSPIYSDRSHGEMFVSMGLSYWETGEQEEAIELTLQGATVMKDAVEDGTLKLEAMAVPYGNLAAMHSQTGDNTQSQEFAKLVAKIDEITSKMR